MSIATADETAVARPQSHAQTPQASDSERESRQWTLKGLAPETVEVTRDAARRSGMKLNSFVSLALERAASEVTSGKASKPAEPEPDDLHAIKEELAKIRAQGEHLESTINSISAILLKLCAEKL